VGLGGDVAQKWKPMGHTWHARAGVAAGAIPETCQVPRLKKMHKFLLEARDKLQLCWLIYGDGHPG
jgi:hypothetical protein